MTFYLLLCTCVVLLWCTYCLFLLLWEFLDCVLFKCELKVIIDWVESKTLVWSSYSCQLLFYPETSGTCIMIITLKSMWKHCTAGQYRGYHWSFLYFDLSWLIFTCHIIEYRAKFDKSNLWLWQVNPAFLLVLYTFC